MCLDPFSEETPLRFDSCKRLPPWATTKSPHFGTWRFDCIIIIIIIIVIINSIVIIVSSSSGSSRSSSSSSS